MDLKVVYWTGALVNMAVITAITGFGVRALRRGQVQTHARLMVTASLLVAAFLLSYVLKVTLLGGEDLGVWSSFYVNTLRFHETCILFMLVGGVVAGVRASRLRRTRRVTQSPDSPPAPATLLLGHRRAGWTAIVSCCLAVLSAGVVLVGMYARL